MFRTLEDLPGRPSLALLGVTDNGGRTFDRYSAGFELTVGEYDDDYVPDEFTLAIGPTGNAPNGVCMTLEGWDPESGTRIALEDVPEAVRSAILGEFDLFATTDGYSS